MADRKPSITSKGAIWIIFATVVLDITGIGIIFPIMPDLLEELGFKSVSNAAVWGGVLATSYALMQFLFSPIIGNISDSIGRRKVILIALFTLSIDYLILGFSKCDELYEKHTNIINPIFIKRGLCANYV